VRNKVVFLNFYNHGGSNQGLKKPTFDDNTVANNWEPKCRTCITSGICFGGCTDYINGLKRNMNRAILNRHTNKLYITYLSAIAKGHPSPKGMARKVNDEVEDYIKDDVTGAVKHMGIVIFDYVTTNLARMVYQTNYLVRKPTWSVSGGCRGKWSWFSCKQKSNYCKSGYYANRYVYWGVSCRCKCCNNMNRSDDFCGPTR